MIEPAPTTRIAKLGVLLLLLGVFLLLYQPWSIAARDLGSSEGFLAAQALEMDLELPMSVAHGTMLRDSFPMFPYCAAIVERLHVLSMEQNLRFLGLAALLATSILIFFSAASNGSFKAGAVAAAVYFSSSIAMEKSVFGLNTNLTVFWLLAAQMSWFYCGVRLGRWNLAWILSFLFASLGFYCGGFAAFSFFLLPLFFMRRPLSLPSKLPKWGFAVGLAIAGGVILSWQLPYAFLGRALSVQYSRIFNAGWGDYCIQLLSTPFSFFLRMAPWTLILWMPFCAALERLDATPMFSRYLRTLAVVSLVIVWCNPLTRATDFLYIAAPLSVLTGLWYEVAVRRYSVQMRKLLGLCVAFLLLSALAIALFALLPTEWLNRIVELPPAEFKRSPLYIAAAISVGNLLLLLAFWGNFQRKQGQVWIQLLLTSLGGAAFFWTVLYPYRVQDDARREIGTQLYQLLDADGASNEAVVYKMGIGGFYAEGFYLRHALRSIADAEAIPSGDQRVYVLSEVFPQDPDRVWSNLLPQDFRYQGKRLSLWRGDLVRSHEKIRMNRILRATRARKAEAGTP